MKTTGEPIEDIRLLKEGDVYVGIYMDSHKYISVFKEILYYSEDYGYDYFDILDSKCVVLNEDTEIAPESLQYCSVDYEFRWPTEEELKRHRHRLKKRKVMFHEDNG